MTHCPIALCVLQHNFVVSDPSLPDNPIVFASSGFYQLTGYTPSEVVGRNCRFLQVGFFLGFVVAFPCSHYIYSLSMQGPETDPAAVALISKGLADGEDTVVCLLNYRKDGSKFYNRFFVAPLRGIDGKIVNFVGVQCEVKESIARELITSQNASGGGAASTSSPRGT